MTHAEVMRAEAADEVPTAQSPAPRLRRRERRDQIVAGATRAFARSGFAATSLDDVAAEAHISRVILYRHFESKMDLYRAVLDRACTRLANAVGAAAEYTADTVDALLRVASEDPDGFRLLFHHAAREPEFRSDIDELHAAAVEIARRQVADQIPDPAWMEWASLLAPTVAVEAVIAWLDVGQPAPERASTRIRQVLAAIVDAARSPEALSQSDP
jgi:AcrR family transcriptional regulator